MAGRRNRGRGNGGGHGGGGGEERWLLPYADMITLLLGLFIVLFAMSTINAKQFDNVRQSLSQAFKGQVLEEAGGVMPGSSGALDPSAANSNPTAEVRVNPEESSDVQKREFSREQKKFEKIAKEAGLTANMKVDPSERGFVISIAGDAFFDTGSSALKPGTRGDLVKIAAELAAFGRSIEVIGHTDGQPGDNWRLSSERALTVWSVLMDEGVAQSKGRFTGQGAFAPKVKPKCPTCSEPRNRRIEIVVLAAGANDAGLPNEREVREQSRTAARSAAAREGTANAGVDLHGEVAARTQVSPVDPIAAVSAG